MSSVPTVEQIGRPFVVKPATSPLGVNEALSRNMKYLTENDHTLIMSKAKPLTFAKGEPLIREGTPSPAFYMIRSGNVRVQRGMTHLATLHSGNLCGEMMGGGCQVGLGRGRLVFVGVGLGADEREYRLHHARKAEGEDHSVFERIQRWAQPATSAHGPASSPCRRRP